VTVGELIDRLMEIEDGDTPVYLGKVELEDVSVARVDGAEVVVLR
jgi:hypothetical protein